MEQAQTKAAADTSTRVVFVNDLPEELKVQLANLFPEFEFAEAPKEQAQPHNRRATDRAIAREKPTLEQERKSARAVLTNVADKYGLVFTVKEIEALSLLGDTFSPMFATAVAKAACSKFVEQGWV